MSKRAPLKQPSATALRLAHSFADVAKITGIASPGVNFCFWALNDILHRDANSVANEA
jgi:hypothetical protein